MQLFITTRGEICGRYTEAIDLRALGRATIRRASQVEPDDDGLWWADLSAVHGPRLGPFAVRSEALTAEINWLEANPVLQNGIV